MSDLRGACHQCGKCCEAIHLPQSPEEIATQAERSRRWGRDDTNDDALFIHHHWKPITHEEAHRINPQFRRNEQGVMLDDDRDENIGAYDRMHFYTCTHLKDGLCSIHEIRPQVCSGYPWYDSTPNPSMLFYAAECGYKIDVYDEYQRSVEKMSETKSLVDILTSGKHGEVYELSGTVPVWTGTQVSIAKTLHGSAIVFYANLPKLNHNKHRIDGAVPMCGAVTGARYFYLGTEEELELKAAGAEEEPEFTEDLRKYRGESDCTPYGQRGPLPESPREQDYMEGMRDEHYDDVR